MKRIVVCGAGGFIGGHLVSRLKKDGHWVRGVDIKFNEFKKTDADEFLIADLRDPVKVDVTIDETIDEVYQLAADMGGSTYINTGEHDSDVMHNSCIINLNVLKTCSMKNVTKIFYSSSACVYPEYNQLDPDNPKCSEDTTYPAEPDSEYGWEKLFSERLYKAFERNHGLNVRIARFHNIYGPLGTFDGGREKAPAAICRKIIEAKIKKNKNIEIWGDGTQTRSFLYIDDCIQGTLDVFNSNSNEVFNVGSEEQVSINQMIEIIEDVANYKVNKNYQLDKPKGVRGRSSDNSFIQKQIGWKHTHTLKEGLIKTYNWISNQIESGTNISKFSKSSIEN